MSRRHLWLLAAAVSDATFARQRLDDTVVWIGKCLHCNSKLVVRDDGRPLGNASLEHVWPQAQGGQNALDNLAVACVRCNREKGTRHDHGKGNRSRLDEVTRLLAERRKARWRDPADVGMAARLAPLFASAGDGDDDSDDG